MDRVLSILVLIATLATIAVNALASTGYINGVTPEVVSGRYPTIVTPAGYAFSIWSLIYVGLAIFSIHQILPANLERYRRIRHVYIASCVLNCAWVYAFHYDQIAACLAIILMLAVSLLLINTRFSGHRSTAETWAVQAAFGVYFGWVTAVSLVNLMILFRHAGSPLAESASVGGIIILFAAICAVVVRIFLSNFFYPLAVAWALTAIAVGQSGSSTIVVAAAIGVVACLITTGTFVVNLKDSSTA